MRKKMKWIVCLLCLIGVAACSNDKDFKPSEAKNILIVYFTHPETDGTDTSAGASRIIENGKTIGNTEFVARVIQERTKGTLYQIRTEVDYPGSHDPLVDQASIEKDENKRPKLATKIENPEQYDVIFIGFPNWWGDLPMPLYTFLEEYDFKGKTIVPFSTHGGSGFSKTINTISEIQSHANVNKNGLTIPRNDVISSKMQVEEWLSDLGYK